MKIFHPSNRGGVFILEISSPLTANSVTGLPFLNEYIEIFTKEMWLRRDVDNCVIPVNRVHMKNHTLDCIFCVDLGYCNSKFFAIWTSHTVWFPISQFSIHFLHFCFNNFFLTQFGLSPSEGGF